MLGVGFGVDDVRGDRTATVTRWMENIDPPPFWAAITRLSGIWLTHQAFRSGALWNRITSPSEQKSPSKCSTSAIRRAMAQPIDEMN